MQKIPMAQPIVNTTKITVKKSTVNLAPDKLGLEHLYQPRPVLMDALRTAAEVFHENLSCGSYGAIKSPTRDIVIIKKTIPNAKRSKGDFTKKVKYKRNFIRSCVLSDLKDTIINPQSN